MLTPSWFSRDAVLIAHDLLGCVVEYDGCAGMIVESEAYTTDPASHAYRLTPRSEIMKTTHGCVYIYFVYGRYFCLNITTNKDGVGAVLIRALEPLRGINVMKERRSTTDLFNLTSGPGKLCQAMKVTKLLNGTEIGAPLVVRPHRILSESDVGTSARIGISQGKDLPWRFFIKNNPHVSGNRPYKDERAGTYNRRTT